MFRLKLTVFLIPFLCVLNKSIAQTQILSTKQGNNCEITMQTSSIKDNLLDIVINANWVTPELKPVVDNESVVCFEYEEFVKSLPQSVRLVTTNQSRFVAFNSSIKLTFEVNEMFKGGNIVFNLPFSYSPSIKVLNETLVMQDFMFKRPKNLIYTVEVPQNSLVHKSLPKIMIVTPEGVEDGMKPIVDTSLVNVKVLATDPSGIDRITINNSPATRLNDSMFVADVNLKVGFENTINTVAVDKHGLSNSKLFLIESRKPTIKMIVSGPTVSPSRSRKPSDVDIDIPITSSNNPNKFALIIGNEDYSTYQNTLKTESDVAYAIHDAEIFKEYAQKVIGIPDENIIMVLNAKALDMHRVLNQVSAIAKNMYGNAELYAFYAGHGFPDETTKEPYLIPVDVNGTDLQFAIKQSDFFKKLTEHPTKRVVVFLDACFSGGGRNQGLIAARGVKVKPKENLLKGNLIVFTASSGAQSSLPYEDKQHGLFTYYLLKKLKETKGEIGLKELSDYLSSEVGVRSITINNKEQNPQVNVSYDLLETWQGWKIK